MSKVQCDRCGGTYGIGDAPDITCNSKTNPGLDPSYHTPVRTHHPFKVYLDEHIQADGKDFGRDAGGNVVQGTLITSHYQRNQILKQQGADYKDTPASHIRELTDKAIDRRDREIREARDR